MSFLKQLCGSNMEKPLNYLETMKLEIERLQLNLSAAERDRALLSVGHDPATIDPNRILKLPYVAQLRKTAQNLALSNHIVSEDKKLSVIGLEEDSIKVSEENTKTESHCSDEDSWIEVKLSGFFESFQGLMLTSLLQKVH